MSSRSFRFAPPAVEPTPALAWLLRAAFSRLELEPLPARGEQVSHLAERLELDHRILHRRGTAIVSETLGPLVASRWSASRRETTARTLVVERLTESLATAARQARVPGLLLKGAALVLGGHTPPGTRRMADVDLLVPAADEARIRRVLQRRGFTMEGLAEPHHTPPLVHAGLGVVELHTSLPGLHRSDGKPLDLDALSTAGLVTQSRLLGLLLPTPPLLAVHIVSHALHQHGEAPAGYPSLRWIGDLLDLADSIDSTGPSTVTSMDAEMEPPLDAKALFAATANKLDLDLSERELEAAATVCDELRRGRLASSRSDAGRLLRHCLAGLLDERYRGALRIRGVMRALLSNRSRLRHRLRQRAVASGAGGGGPGSYGSSLVRIAYDLGRDLRGWTLVRLRRRPRPLL